MALNGVCRGLDDGLEAWDVVVGCGVVRSVREAEERRSVTAEVAVVGTLEAWVWEAV